jgi:hypothetical protein
MVARPDALVEFLTAEYAAGQAARETLPVARGENPVPALNELLRTWVGA